MVAGEQQITSPTGPPPILKQSQEAVELELKMVKEVVQRDPTLRVFLKRIAISVPLELIKVI